MSPESEQLKAARASGSLTNVIGALREEARTELANASTPVREEVGLEDATIRVAAGLAGTKGAERRQALSDVQVGKTVTAQGVAKTQLSRAEKIERVKAWAAPMSEDQREAFILSESFEKLSDRQQEIIAEVFSDISDKAYSDSIGIADVDFDAESPDVDSIIGDEDEDEFDSNEDTDYESQFNPAAWETEGTT
jgi:hypothetical protein